LHLLFDALLKALEKEQLRPTMVGITQATLARCSHTSGSHGTPLEDRNDAGGGYFRWRSSFSNPEAAIDPAVADLVAQQVSQSWMRVGEPSR